AAGMIGIGGYHQFNVQKNAEKNISKGKISVNKKLRRALKAEVALGVVLLGIVALLTNGTLPEGEIPRVEAQEVYYGFSTIGFGEQTKFYIEILPFSTGTNLIKVQVTDFSDQPLSDLDDVKVKVSNPLRNIAPIVIPMEITDKESQKFQGEITFGFSGNWQIEVEVQRTQSGNEIITLMPLIKPTLDNIKTEITEFSVPEESSPLYPIFDGKGNIWISDASNPRVWKFSIDNNEFEKFEFDGQASITLTQDKDGKIWFTDIPEGRIGFIEPNSGESQIIEFPDIIPVIDRNFAITLDVDNQNGIWTTIANKNVLVRYDQTTKEFEQFKLPTKDSGPFAVVVGPDGKIWFSQQTAGQIGYLVPETGEIKEFTPNPPLATPETITIDKDGNLWIAEHQERGGITKFDPLLNTFERIKSPDNAAFPNSAAFGKYQNVWFAM
ncbi:MAG: copper resistance protein CopD, partial [Nitrosopumilaceae archaeon]|nr:copper resistance protein CopD [Nitrosopumilaceae archaeon]